jgi:hypothetical protein
MLDFTGLLEPQKPHALKLLNSLYLNDIACDCSETGCGKTFSSAWIAKHLGVPVVVICPLSAVETWQKVLPLYDVKPGDLVVTGGLDNIFPKGFPIAIVEATEKKHISVSLKVDLKPLVDPDKVEEVFVVTNAANQDLSELLASETKN